MNDDNEFDFSEATQGAVVASDAAKTRITIRLDTDVLNWFRQQVHDAGVEITRLSSTTRCANMCLVSTTNLSELGRGRANAPDRG